MQFRWSDEKVPTFILANKKFNKNGTQNMYIMENELEMVAACVLKLDADICRMEFIAVKEIEYANGLYKAVCEMAREHGKHSIVLKVDSNRREVLEWAKKIGMVEKGGELMEDSVYEIRMEEQLEVEKQSMEDLLQAAMSAFDEKTANVAIGHTKDATDGLSACLSRLNGVEEIFSQNEPMKVQTTNDDAELEVLVRRLAQQLRNENNRIN